MERVEHNFNERKQERNKKGEIVDVITLPKYHDSKAKAIDLIENGDFGLTDADFWILKNEDRNGRVYYNGLIISHNGCLKINDHLPKDKRFNPANYRIDYIDNSIYKGLLTTYIDSELVEYGEVTKENCKNQYIFAMALKRLFDRVVLKKSKVAFDGIYSEVEADSFVEPLEVPEKLDGSKSVDKTKEEKKEIAEDRATPEQIAKIVEHFTADRIQKMLAGYKVNSLQDLTISQASSVCEVARKEKMNGTDKGSK